MIKLDKTEKKLIRICKLHYKRKYRKGPWTESLKPFFVETWGWDPDEDNNYQDYLNCIFNKLFATYTKIADDRSGHGVEMKELFQAAFRKGISNDQELPIERAITHLCGLIQNTYYLDESGKPRYSLGIRKKKLVS